MRPLAFSVQLMRKILSIHVYTKNFAPKTFSYRHSLRLGVQARLPKYIHSC